MSLSTTQLRQSKKNVKKEPRFTVRWPGSVRSVFKGPFLAITHVQTRQGTDRTEPGRQQALSRRPLCWLLLLSMNCTDAAEEQKVKRKKILLPELDVSDTQLMSQQCPVHRETPLTITTDYLWGGCYLLASSFPSTGVCPVFLTWACFSGSSVHSKLETSQDPAERSDRYFPTARAGSLNSPVQIHVWKWSGHE